MPDSKKTIFFVSTFPPRECGLATFTADLIESFEKLFSPYITTKVIAMNEGERSFYVYPPKKVIYEIERDQPGDYQKAAELVNREQPALICIQHEFGIFGGSRGSFVIDFLRAVEVPRAVVLHTVLSEPEAEYRETMRELEGVTELFIVMTKISRDVLIRDYGIAPEKIAVIPHGIPAVSYALAGPLKKEFGLDDKTVLTTFGLLSRNKGIEYVLRALPKVIEKFPNVVYLVVGATHPNIVKNEGEEYRRSLFREVQELGLAEHVRFYNKYFDSKDLLKILTLTDVYVATSLDPRQAVSGTLSYAIGVGRPVVTTRFSQAQELVTSGLGKLVPMRESAAFSEALIELLGNPERLQVMGHRAYIETRHMTWSNVANAYYLAFSKLVPELAISERRLPTVKLTHLERMTTERGILQFSFWHMPTPESGYTLDDNARALWAVALAYRHLSSKKTALHLAKTYLDFIRSCPVEDELLLNIFHFDHSPNMVANSESREDAHTRSLLALSYVSAASDLPADLKASAQEYFDRLMKDGMKSFHYPRAQATFVKALAYQLTRADLSEETQDRYKEIIAGVCQRLVEKYREHSTSTWRWFEPALTYSNASLPETLFVGASLCQSSEFLTLAQEALDFLLEKTIINGQAAPIGQNGWFPKGGDRQFYDQQPEEVAALILCLDTAWQCTRDERYRKEMQVAFSWFLGNNSRGIMVYDEVTGGCYDGLNAEAVNLNEGSESVICYLLARLAVEQSPGPALPRLALRKTF